MSVTTVKMKDIDPKLTEEEKKDIEKAKKKKVVFDEDSPEITEDMIFEFKRLYGKNRRKETISMRISPETLEKAKQYGKGYTSFLSRLLDLAINDEELVKKCI